MNSELQEFARNKLKEGLAKLPREWQQKFKQMYANGDLEMEINDVVNLMNESKLDWAMQQVSNSLKDLDKT